MKEFVSWELIDECVTEIAFHIKDTGKDFKGVYGIPRGGSLLAVMLSHKLDLPYIENPYDVEDDEFVIIDDIVDTGKTLEFYEDTFLDSYIVTIHEHEQSIIKPKYSVINKGDKWIVYPWETEDSEEIQDYLK
jgi:hypoxanthine phosphoribosyltransferase